MAFLLLIDSLSLQENNLSQNLGMLTIYQEEKREGMIIESRF